MKKILFIFSLLFSILSASAQFSVTGSSGYVKLDDKTGVDYVFIINQITSSTEITYDLPYTTINWYKYSDPVSSISNLNYISPDGETGYILEVDGVKKTLWVIEYQDYILNPATASLTWDESTGEPQCDEVILVLSGMDNLAIPYKTADGITYSLPREFTITYQTLEWGDDSWNDLEKKETFTLTRNSFDVESPLVETIFTLSGDQYASMMGLNPVPSVSSDEFPTPALQSHITTSTVVREALNEVDRPSDAKQLEGSAPLEINFKSNSSSPDNSYYNWIIYKSNIQIITRAEPDQRYTFTEPGEYKVNLTLSNDQGCSYIDSVSVSVSESMLKVPNAFSPNGDGMNDEFRVAYRSLKTFRCEVYNNWGNLVYDWTDPAKGWDGRVNGKNAREGTYFYIIRAEGTDGKKYKLKGSVDIFR